jgi:tRNA dimethylallyltransferase
MKLHIVAGPTASGKTDLAIKLAEKSQAVLINADSRQIYKHLNIVTNKGELEQPSEIKLQSGTYPVHRFKDTEVLIHLVGFLEPDKDFSVADYQKLVFELINSLDTDQEVILVGGTGLYIDAVIHPAKYTFAKIAPSQKLKYTQMSVGELHHRIR